MDDIPEKILRYEEFLNDRLRTDLHTVLERKENVYKDVAEFTQLKSAVDLLKNEAKKGIKSHKTMVDLGCNFYANARVEDCSTIFIAIGLGFHLEMTLEEASVFIEEKISELLRKAEIMSIQASQINARIKVVMETLRELQFPFEEKSRTPTRDVW